jgi:hypothetical protein
LDAKDKETLSLYVGDNLTFDEYRNMRKMIEGDRLVIKTELEKIAAIEEEPTVSRENILLNFKENWALLTNTERRTFLRDFIDKIVTNSERAEGEPFGTIHIVDVVFRAD